ncbi:hypothetical protein GI374_12305 [Paracoccus sp. S-4012]|uniref:superoxide dismutase family protein n=1 Tax=Paracoccus sp. S-4012 TaxID=2665648 RepID=UPI0012B08D72|nr:superoxide dismutase family protein [Paracoccus sp. S-4012]MRX51213.1 hypothetical protein [Paracoccus sp. S-4012]
MTKLQFRCSTAALLLALAGGAANGHGAEAWDAVLKNADGGEVGRVEAAPMPSGGVHLKITVSGFEPGVKAIHVHEIGDCSGEGFAAAGPHMGGAGHAQAAGSHAQPAAADASVGHDHAAVVSGDAAHPGDLPNLHLPESGALTVEYFAPHLAPAMLSDADGASIIMHAEADDYSGVAGRQGGARMACGAFEAR